MLKKITLSLLSVCTSLFAGTSQAIVFDFGGVMTKEPDREVVVQFLCSSFHLSSDEFEKVNQEKRKALAAGSTDAAFWRTFAQTHEVNLPKGWEADFHQVLKKSINVNPAMFALVQQLKDEGLTVGLLSNIDARRALLIRDFGFYEPFDPCLLSYEIGVEKPDPRAYERLLEKMKLAPSAIVFVDDMAENIAAAKELGFDALLFTSQEALEAELRKRGLLLTSLQSQK